MFPINIVKEYIYVSKIHYTLLFHFHIIMKSQNHCPLKITKRFISNEHFSILPDNIDLLELYLVMWFPHTTSYILRIVSKFERDSFEIEASEKDSRLLKLSEIYMAVPAIGPSTNILKSFKVLQERNV